MSRLFLPEWITQSVCLMNEVTLESWALKGRPAGMYVSRGSLLGSGLERETINTS